MKKLRTALALATGIAVILLGSPAVAAATGGMTHN
jgi:hypothetical protein